MPEATSKEIQASITELIAYRDRLKKEVTSVSQRLKMPQKKVEKIIEENAELKKIDEALSRLKNQMKAST